MQILKFYSRCMNEKDFPGGSDGKDFASNVEDLGSIPGLGRSPGEEKGNPLQYPCLENSMDRGVWWAPVCGVIKSQTQKGKHTSDLKNLLKM